MTPERDLIVECEETGERFVWPFCTVPGCENRICRGRSDIYCWPHWMSGGSPALGREKVIGEKPE